jgi:hypothetical protein
VSFPAADAGLSLDQAPPLSIPMSFFLTATGFVALAGILLLVEGDGALASQWVPTTIALTHVGTFGFLATIMMGALYQMTPVVAGARVPAIRLAHVVQALACTGVLLVVASFWGSVPVPGVWGFGLMALALVLFAVPVGIALFRVEAHNQTVRGMRLSLVAFCLLGGLGVAMSHGWGGGSGGSSSFPGNRSLWVMAHLGIAFIGWIGGLLSAVSWQILPMFYLATSPSRRIQRAVSLMIASTMCMVAVGPALEPLAGLETARWWVAAAALPGGLAVWLLHPITSLHALARRRRRRVDPSVRFWQASMGIAPLCGIGLLGVHLSDDPRIALATGWVVVWGWAGLVVHGMLTRITPFLVWFHRFSHLIGQQPVPPLRRMLPDRWTNQALVLHLGTLATGLLAIAIGGATLSRITGVGMVLTALLLGRTLVFLLRLRPTSTAASSGDPVQTESHAGSSKPSP